MNWQMPRKNVVREVGKVVAGKDKYIRKVMLAILAGGHILMDDIPGLGENNDGIGVFQSHGSKAKSASSLHRMSFPAM